MPMLPPEALYATILDGLVRAEVKPEVCIERLVNVCCSYSEAAKAMAKGERFPVDTDPVGQAGIEIQAIVDYLRLQPIVKSNQYFNQYLKSRTAGSVSGTD